jgi:RNA polymerase sigma factor (sigma-70 family)
MTLLDMVSDGIAPQPEDDYKWMHQQVRQLERRERTVLELRYQDHQMVSFARIAEMTGLSKDQVQRLERNALQKLRRRLTPILNPD